MKRLFVPVIIALFVIACKKDNNDPTLTNNSNSSPCDNVQCVAGECNDGICDCYVGWGGNLCDIQLVPVSMQILSLRIEDCPIGDDGPYTQDPAEPYPIFKHGNNVIWQGENWNEITSGNIYLDEVFVYNLVAENIIITDYSQNFTFSMYDDDEGEDGTDDLIVTFTIDAYDSDNFSPLIAYSNNTMEIQRTMYDSSTGTKIKAKFLYSF